MFCLDRLQHADCGILNYGHWYKIKDDSVIRCTDIGDMVESISCMHSVFGEILESSTSKDDLEAHFWLTEHTEYSLSKHYI